MKLRLSVPDQVQEILNKFEKNGLQIFIVGGVVRDILLDRPLVDWDFTTDAVPEEILKLFPDGYYDNKYGTVGVPGDDGQRPFEITTFRTEGGYSDSRHPDEVKWGKSLEEDLQRRDFTINALALRRAALAQGKPSFEVIDLFGGEKDLQAKVIRAVGNPTQRFTEDALRMMRAVRL